MAVRLGRSGQPLTDSATKHECSSGSLSLSLSVFVREVLSMRFQKPIPIAIALVTASVHRGSLRCAGQAKATPFRGGRLLRSLQSRRTDAFTSTPDGHEDTSGASITGRNENSPEPPTRALKGATLLKTPVAAPGLRLLSTGAWGSLPSPLATLNADPNRLENMCRSEEPKGWDLASGAIRAVATSCWFGN